MRSLLILNGLLIVLGMIAGNETKKSAVIQEKKEQFLKLVGKIEKTVAAAKRIKAAKKRGEKPKNEEEAAVWAAIMLKYEALDALPIFAVDSPDFSRTVQEAMKGMNKEEVEDIYDLFFTLEKEWEKNTRLLHQRREALNRGDIAPETIEEIRERARRECPGRKNPCNNQISYDNFIFFQNNEEFLRSLIKKCP